MTEGDNADDGLTREERFRAQTTEQYAALGRFVQAFEQMVDAYRSAIMFMMNGPHPGQQLTRALIYHPVMTAKPLFEVMRAQFGVHLDHMGSQLDGEERRVVEGALGYLAAECSDLFSLRNILVHGTWFIGWASADQQDFSEMEVVKFNIKPSGARLAKTPKSAKELDALTARCVAAQQLVQRMWTCFISPGGPRVRRNIRQEGKVWLAEPPQD